MAVPNQELSLEQEQDDARHDPDTGQETGPERRDAAKAGQEKPKTLQEVVKQIKLLAPELLSTEGKQVESHVEAISRLLDGVQLDQFPDHIRAEVQQAVDGWRQVDQPAQHLQELISALETSHARLATELDEGGYGDDDDLTQAKPVEITDEVTHMTGAEAFTPDMAAEMLIRKIVRLIDTGQNPMITSVDRYIRDQGGTFKPNVTARLDTHGNLIIGERQANGISKEDRIMIPVEAWHDLMRHPELTEDREQIERTLAEHTIEYVPDATATTTTAANMAPANMAPANEKTAGPVVRMAA